MADADHMPMHSSYMDYAEHERTYRGFTFAAKWGTAVIAGIIILLAIFLV